MPVVSTRVGMSADSIRHGINGVLTEIDDVQALSENVGYLMQDPVKALSLGSEGLKSAARFDWKKIAGEYYQKVYEPYL